MPGWRDYARAKRPAEGEPHPAHLGSGAYLLANCLLCSLVSTAREAALREMTLQQGLSFGHGRLNPRRCPWPRRTLDSRMILGVLTLPVSGP
jgi:hypothetical protein